MKTLTFVQISDSRFSGSEKELESICKNVVDELSSLIGVSVRTENMRVVKFTNFESSDSYSWRKRVFVQKTKETTWNNIYKTVNKVKSVPYKFVQDNKF